MDINIKDRVANVLASETIDAKTALSGADLDRVGRILVARRLHEPSFVLTPIEWAHVRSKLPLESPYLAIGLIHYLLGMSLNAIVAPKPIPPNVEKQWASLKSTLIQTDQLANMQKAIKALASNPLPASDRDYARAAWTDMYGSTTTAQRDEIIHAGGSNQPLSPSITYTRTLLGHVYAFQRTSLALAEPLSLMILYKDLLVTFKHAPNQTPADIHSAVATANGVVDTRRMQVALHWKNGHPRILDLKKWQVWHNAMKKTLEGLEADWLFQDSPSPVAASAPVPGVSSAVPSGVSNPASTTPLPLVPLSGVSSSVAAIVQPLVPTSVSPSAPAPAAPLAAPVAGFSDSTPTDEPFPVAPLMPLDDLWGPSEPSVEKDAPPPKGNIEFGSPPEQKEREEKKRDETPEPTEEKEHEEKKQDESSEQRDEPVDVPREREADLADLMDGLGLAAAGDGEPLGLRDDKALTLEQTAYLHEWPARESLFRHVWRRLMDLSGDRGSTSPLWPNEIVLRKIFSQAPIESSWDDAMNTLRNVPFSRHSLFIRELHDHVWGLWMVHGVFLDGTVPINDNNVMRHNAQEFMDTEYHVRWDADLSAWAWDRPSILEKQGNEEAWVCYWTSRSFVTTQLYIHTVLGLWNQDDMRRALSSFWKSTPKLKQASTCALTSWAGGAIQQLVQTPTPTLQKRLRALAQSP